MSSVLVRALLFFFSFTFAHEAFAAKQFEVSGMNKIVAYGIRLVPPTCDELVKRMRADLREGSYCDGFDDALSQGIGAKFIFNSPLYLKAYGYGPETVTVSNIYGSCNSGASGEDVEILAGYGKPATGEITQVLAEPSPWSQSGCMVRVKDEKQCYARSGDAEVAPGIKKVYCLSSTVETGADGGANGSPSEDSTPYSGSGDGGTGGGGTDPGTGGGGGGGTDPGTGGGGTGGGGTGGGGTGGGTDPGTGGGGGTDPGTGGGGTGGSGFCQQNPNLNICKNSSVGGTCGDISCDGDAIQCSILREAAKANCRDVAEREAASGSAIGKLGQGVLDGNDPDGDKLPKPGNGQNISVPSSLDQSGWLGGGQCFSDKTFTVQGRQIVIPFSQACGALIVLRYAIMIVATLVSFKMLSGAIIRE